MNNFEGNVEEKFLAILRANLIGLRAKVVNDFSEENFLRELQMLQNDPVYSSFAFASPEYLLIRLMGRISISIGRRLGEIYDKIPRIAASARFGLSAIQVAPLLEKLELDVALNFAYLSNADVEHIRQVVRHYLSSVQLDSGVGIEVRYNFNPNDSSRLRKDAMMATYVRNEKLLPIYLVFSTISPRAEAIARLERAGWEFLIGETAIAFAKDLLNMDLAQILEAPEIKAEIHRDVNEIIGAMMTSYAFQEIIKKYR
jgi:hypothetical protein